MADQYGLIPLPLGVPFDAAAAEQPNQPALPFGGYIEGWAETGLSVSAALAEGADVLAAQVEPTVAVSLARTEGADVLAAQVGPQVAASSALNEGADVLASQVGPRIGVSSALAEGADTLAAQIDAQVAVSLAQTEGADLLAAAVDIMSGTVDFSAALLEGPDTLDASVSTAQGGGYDDAKKRRFIQRVGDKLIVTTDASRALSAVADAPPEAAVERPAVAPEAEPAPEIVQEVALPTIRAYAELAGRINEYQVVLQSRHYEALLALFEQLQDEEDIEMLLLAV